jgi:hypothetical protein
MSFATSEPLFHDHCSLEDDQESGESGTMGSSGIRSLFPKLENKQRAAFMGPVFQMTLNEQVTAIVAGFTIVLSLVAMSIEGSVYAIISGLLSIIMGSYSHYQQMQLTKLEILREKSIVLEKEIVRLEGDNTRLTYDVDELDGRVEDLLDVEDALTIISQGQSVDALQKDADANLEVVCKMKQSVEASAIETLVSSLYCRLGDSKTDMDMPITEKETTRMIEKLQNIAGLSVDEGRLRDTIVGNSIESIIDAVQNLLNEDIPAMSRMFQVK